jgi:hypothetical protein
LLHRIDALVVLFLSFGWKKSLIYVGRASLTDTFYLSFSLIFSLIDFLLVFVSFFKLLLYFLISASVSYTQYRKLINP